MDGFKLKSYPQLRNKMLETCTELKKKLTAPIEYKKQSTINH